MCSDFPEGYFHTCKVDNKELERWIPEAKNSFLNRLQYSVKNPDEVNHEPIATINKDKSNKIINIKTRPKEKIKLDAAGSSDPDGDEISYRWSFYKEASSYPGEFVIKENNISRQELVLPEDIGDKNIHIILEVKDNGSPALVSYRRVILSAQ